MDLVPELEGYMKLLEPSISWNFGRISAIKRGSQMQYVKRRLHLVLSGALKG